MPEAFFTPGNSSFTDFLAAHADHLLPGRSLPAGAVMPELPHATTIVTVTFDGGVVMGGDRRATSGNYIAHREMEKVYPADDYSVVGISGAVGPAIEMIKLFQVELEHYEKIEGALMSLDGKANRLATMLRGNLPLAMQGLAVVPLYAGYDLDRNVGRIFSYDVSGARFEEHSYQSTGSGSLFAKGSLKKRWRPGLDAGEAVSVVLEALQDAADDDSATGGSDVARRIYPVVAVVDAEGYRRLGQDETEAAFQALTERGDAR
nr:proteasome subunit beta [Kineosporia rhizophila]